MSEYMTFRTESGEQGAAGDAQRNLPARSQPWEQIERSEISPVPVARERKQCR